ncbi:MAG: hypothetical protein DRP35_01460 [Candidatus Zixiibacteriota bacterium]|nr:MAG: hypothetical protein DRP35_01460 [candidate division Zixibacteria bacterium]
MSYRLNIFCLILLLILVTGCGKKIIIGEENHSQIDKIAVQANGGYTISSNKLYQILNESDLVPFGGVVPKNELVAYLDSIVLSDLAYIASYQVNLKEYPQLWIEYNTRYGNFLNKTFIEEFVKKNMTADSMEVVEHFYGNPELYNLEEQVDMSQILIKKSGLLNSADSLKYKAMSPEELDEALKDYAFYVYSLIGKTKMFGSAAREYSHDELSGPNDGRIGFVGRGIYYDPFDSVAFSLKSGEWSEPYLDPDGWHIIYVEEYIPDGLPEFTTDVYNFAMVNVLTEKSNKRGSEVIDSLKNLVKDIVYNDEVLGGDIYKMDIDTWLAIVDGVDTVKSFHIRKYEETYRSRYKVRNTTSEMKKNMINDALNWFVLRKAAYKMKIDTLPWVIATKNKIWSNLGMQIVYNDSKDFGYKVPDSLSRKYYEEHKSDYVYDDNFYLQQIICEDSVYCEFVRDQSNTGIDFMELAKEYSIGETVEEKLKLADIGDVSKEDISNKMWVSLFKVKEGEVSFPVKLDDYYHIIKKVKVYVSESYEKAKYKIDDLFKKRHDEEVKKNFKKKLFDRFNVKYLFNDLEFELEPLMNR